MIHIVSTGKDAKTKDRCIASVQSQKLDGIECVHHYIEAGNGFLDYKWEAVELRHYHSQGNIAVQSWHGVVSTFQPWDIVIQLDGDDRFAHPYVIERVAGFYRDPNVWVTYGQFVFEDGRAGFAEPYGPNEDVRKTHWRATHLKTYRAGLAQRIKLEDLQQDGQWITRAWDMAIMMPLLEMAGSTHTKFNPEVLYVYNLATSFEWNAKDVAELRHEKSVDAWVRSRPKYAPLASLP
jgi:hypothetical protein